MDSVDFYGAIANLKNAKTENDTVEFLEELSDRISLLRTTPNAHYLNADTQVQKDIRAAVEPCLESSNSNVLWWALHILIGDCGDSRREVDA